MGNAGDVADCLELVIKDGVHVLPKIITCALVANKHVLFSQDRCSKFLKGSFFQPSSEMVQARDAIRGLLLQAERFHTPEFVNDYLEDPRSLASSTFGYRAALRYLPIRWFSEQRQMDMLVTYDEEFGSLDLF